MTTRGRPPSTGGALTAAQRKTAQRARDRVAIWSGGSMDELTITALLENLPSLIVGERPGTLGAVLVELGRRGGVTVTARPSSAGAGARLKLASEINRKVKA